MSTLESLKTTELPPELTVNEGITEEQIEELIHYSSSDEQVAAQTSDPKRFKNRAAYDEWTKKRRTIYTMADTEDTLLGIIWYGTQPLPRDKTFIADLNLDDYGITFAIRIYGQARGRKLANPFMASAWRKYSISTGYQQQTTKGVWLETNERNVNAVNAYKRFGFQQISSSDEHNRILMIVPLTNSLF